MAAEGIGEASRHSASSDDAQGEVFELGQEDPVEATFSYDDEAPNLVTEFKGHPEGRQALKRVSMRCLNDFERAWEATEKIRKNNADIWKLFAGTLEPKAPPFENMANAHVPILMENTLRMVYRQAYELFGNWSNVFGVNPIGPDDEHLAKLLSLHGNWQIRRRIPDFKRQIGHRGLLIFNMFGDVTCHSYWDSHRRCNRHEILTANEFVCSNTHVSTMLDYSDVAWVAKIIYMDAHEIRKMAGAWEDIDTVLKTVPPEWDDPVLSQEMREAVDKSIGVDSTAFEKGQYKIIQFEGWLNLPAQKRDRYCKLLIDFDTKTIVSMNIHERVDPFDKRRYQFELQQLQQYQQGQQAEQQHQQALQHFQDTQQQTKQAAMEMALQQRPDSGLPGQGVILAKAVDQMPAPQGPAPVPMPDWMKGDPEAQPEPPVTVPIRMFAHGVNIEPIEGVIGLGMGSVLGPQNKAANILMSMFIDQGALGNFRNYLAKGELRLPDKFTLAPGKVHKVEGSTDLSKDIVPMDFGQANPQLAQLIEMITSSAQAVSNTPEVLSGDAGKSGETAQGLANRIEQATKMLSVPTQKYADFTGQVLVNNAILNATFLEDVEFFSVNNSDPTLGPLGRQQFNVGRDMYDRPYDVEFTADLKFTSTTQRISEADALVQLPNAVPILQNNFAFQHATIQKSLEARSRYDLVALLGAPPQPPPMFGASTSPPAPPPGVQPPSPPGAGAPNGQQKPGAPQQPKPQPAQAPPTPPSNFAKPQQGIGQ